MVAGNFVLNAEALQSNQGGKLSDAQRRGLGTFERGNRKSQLTWAAFALAVAAILLFVPGFSGPPLVRYGLAFACVVVAVALLTWSVTALDSLARDLKDGKVESLEGAIGKRHPAPANGSSAASVHFLDVADKSFTVHTGTYEAAPDAGYVRIYYLPRSRHVVNLERLPDGPAPDISTPQGVVRAIGSSIFTGNREKRNEARAGIQAISDKMEAQVTHNATPPPTASSDPRSLSEAIVGTWRSMMMTLIFHADGTVEADLVGGGQRSGRWSVDADGRLHADITGQDGAADAWVQGNQLTISLDGTELTFDRETG
jgi:hypothetical protein